jgi:hypothetical protein
MAIVRNTQTNVLYRYLGENRYRNLCSGVEGEIKEELAQKIFKINAEATVICEEYPMVEELIKSLNLKLDNNKK